ncbi:hypothetical protein J25TS5_14410 [Paenibacillus faecis]|uniref:hypothetical protein n=1 Tax=Paenibacillus faecis TaxID=862114 RepID=UPI001B14E074|nr:hypothetical protein [Paenibacillus faecis]GIO84509.1 hypothetical protein J25TS5_14410 [Paenibacillus faecis]
MSIQYSSEEIITVLESKKIEVFPAESYTSDIGFSQDNLDNFIDLLQKLNVRIAFIEVTILRSEDVDNKLITDEDISPSYVRLALKKQIEEFNLKIEQMRQHIGKEQRICLFFVHQGVIYTCDLINNDLLFDIDKDGLIEDWFDIYVDEIEEVEHQLKAERSEELNQKLKKIRNVLFNDELFKKCKNKELRRSYIYKALRENDDLKDISGVPAGIIMDTVENVWREIKLKKLEDL